MPYNIRHFLMSRDQFNRSLLNESIKFYQNKNEFEYGNIW